MISIYGKPSCPHCVEAKSLTESNGLAYNYISIGTDIGIEDFKSLFPLARTVPQIIIDGVKIGGYTEFKQWIESRPQPITG